MEEILIRVTTTQEKPNFERGKVTTNSQGWVYFENELPFIDKDIFRTKESIDKDTKAYESAKIVSKDLIIGQTYSARKISASGNSVLCEELVTGAAIVVSDKDYDACQNDQPYFSVIITSKRGDSYYASRKEAQKQIDFVDLAQFLKDDVVFEIEITEKTKGGLFGVYNENIRVFLPGSLAAANIVTDFDAMVGKKVMVMVDNFDTRRSNYIVSVKKYLEYTSCERVKDIKFGELYSGRLTTDAHPIKGVYVELDNGFTGNILPTEFYNYESRMKDLRQGMQISAFVKYVYFKESSKHNFSTDGIYEAKMKLTLDYGSIDKDSLFYQDLKDKYDGKLLDYSFDEELSQIIPMLDGMPILPEPINVDARMVKDLVVKSSKIQLTINPIKKRIDNFVFLG